MPEYTFICEKCSSTTSLVCMISEYNNNSKKIKCSSCGGAVYRDFSIDNIGGFVSVGLSDCKTIGQYAEKQTAKYGKQKVEHMMQQSKTKKTGGMDKLPKGMTRIEQSNDSIKWTKD